MNKSLKTFDICFSVIALILIYLLAYYFENIYRNGIWFMIFPCIYVPVMRIKEIIMRKTYKEKYINLYK